MLTLPFSIPPTQSCQKASSQLLVVFNEKNQCTVGQNSSSKCESLALLIKYYKGTFTLEWALFSKVPTPSKTLAVGVPK